MHSNRYTFLYAIGISILTASILAVAAQGFKPLQDANIALDKKTNILRSVHVDSKDRATIEGIYKDRIREMVIDGQGNELSGVGVDQVVLKNEIGKPGEQRKLPLYLYTAEDGKTYYILPLQGVGLWGPIWGYLSVSDDFDTVYGAFFDHKSETPGLGAEISEKPFQKQFEGKKIMSGEQFMSVHVVKKAAKVEFGDEYRVDGISGGTITSNGTDAMLKNCIQPYIAYFNKNKKS